MPPKLNKTSTQGFCSKLANSSKGVGGAVIQGTKSYFEEDDYEFDDKIKNLNKKLKAECDEMNLIDELLAEKELRISKLDVELDKFLVLGEAAAEKVTTEPKYLDSPVNVKSSFGTAMCPPKKNKQLGRPSVHRSQLSNEQSSNSETKFLKLDDSGGNFDLKKYLAKCAQKIGQAPHDRPCVHAPLGNDDIRTSSSQNPETNQPNKLEKVKQKFRNSKKNKQLGRPSVHRSQLSNEQSSNSETKFLKLDDSGGNFDLNKYLAKCVQKIGQALQDRPCVHAPLGNDEISTSSSQNSETNQPNKLEKVKQKFRNSNFESDGSSTSTSMTAPLKVLRQTFLLSSSSNSDDVGKPQKLPTITSPKFSPYCNSPVKRSQKKCLAKKQPTLHNRKRVQGLISNRLALSSSDESVYSDSDDVGKPQPLPPVKCSNNRKCAPTSYSKPSTSVAPEPGLQISSGPDIDLQSILDACLALCDKGIDKLQPSSNESVVKRRASSAPPCKTINNKRDAERGKEKIPNGLHLFSRLLNGERCFPDISEISTTKQTLYMAEQDAYLLFRQQFADRGNVGAFVERPNEFEEFFCNYLCGTSKINVPICSPKTKLKKIPMDPGLQGKVLDLSFDFPDKDPELIALLMNQKIPVWINPQSLAELVMPNSFKQQISATDVRLTVPGSVTPKTIPVESINSMSPQLLNNIEATIKSSAYLYPTDESVLEEIKDVIVVVPEKADKPNDHELIDNNTCIIKLHPFHVETLFQLRGANAPLWFPGMYTAFPDGKSIVQLINTPSTLISTGWKLCAP